MQRKTYRSIPLRSRRAAPVMSATTEAGRTSFVSRAAMPALPDDEQASTPARIGRSAVRYRTTEGHEAIRVGNRQIVVHHEPARRRPRSWVLFLGLGMTAMLLLIAGVNWIGGQWAAHTLDSQYGFPRTFQLDAVTGIDGDSPAHPSHFWFSNLNGRILFIDLPAGDVSHARIYPVMTLQGEDAAQVPVTASVADVNHDGRPDLLIQVGGQSIVYLNTGSGFQPE